MSDADALPLVTVLAAVLDRLIGANDTMVAARSITKFHALKPPSISVLDYLIRIHKYARCSTECFVLALIYIDRLIQRNNFILSGLNVHRVVITSVMLAAKFFDDQYFNNAYYAKVGGVPCVELNQLEVDFLFRVNFSLRVTADDFFRYQGELATHASVHSDGLPPLPLVKGPQGESAVCPPTAPDGQRIDGQHHRPLGSVPGAHM